MADCFAGELDPELVHLIGEHFVGLRRARGEGDCESGRETSYTPVPHELTEH